MLNLKHYNKSSADFLTNIINSKRTKKDDPDYKTRLLALETEIQTHFLEYDTLFGTNTLQNLNPVGYLNTAKDDLLTLYSYRSAIIQKLKSGVTTLELKRVINTCQNCTIGEVNSFDHAVPQTEFPEFTVHPKNLFPSCTKCNSYKSSQWRKDGNRLFLNLYLDELPLQQYLFVTVSVLPGDLNTTFQVDNRNAIEVELYNKIQYHYQTLRLCDRFTENVDKVITPLKHNIKSSLKHLTIEEAVEVAQDKASRDRSAYGYNYWKSILELELLSNNDFLRICENE